MANPLAGPGQLTDALGPETVAGEELTPVDKTVIRAAITGARADHHKPDTDFASREYGFRDLLKLRGARVAALIGSTFVGAATMDLVFENGGLAGSKWLFTALGFALGVLLMDACFILFKIGVITATERWNRFRLTSADIRIERFFVWMYACGGLFMVPGIDLTRSLGFRGTRQGFVWALLACILVVAAWLLRRLAGRIFGNKLE